MFIHFSIRPNDTRPLSFSGIPPGFNTFLVRISGGVAALNHRLIAAVPPGQRQVKATLATYFIDCFDVSSRKPAVTTFEDLFADGGGGTSVGISGTVIVPVANCQPLSARL